MDLERSDEESVCAEEVCLDALQVAVRATASGFLSTAPSHEPFQAACPTSSLRPRDTGSAIQSLSPCTKDCSSLISLKPVLSNRVQRVLLSDPYLLLLGFIFLPASENVLLKKKKMLKITCMYKMPNT